MINPEAKEIGKIYKEAREKIGISVEEANERSRIHLNVINDIESGVFGRLNKLYVKSFLKKYAIFLNLDAGNILKKFDELSGELPKAEFNPDIKMKEEPIERGPSFAMPEKTIQMVLVGLFSVVLLVLIFVLAGRLKSKFVEARQRRAATVTEAKATTAPVVKKEKAPAASTREGRTTQAAKKPTVELTLEARGEAWVKVTEGNKTLFVGVLRKGDKKSFESDKAIAIWTGRAEMLDFIVNRKKLGKIADGVIKNIKISKEGITIDDNWVTRF